MGDLHKVLLVDDDPGVMWGIGRFLTNSEWSVTICQDGVEAIELLDETDFNAVVTDVQMPRLNGLAVVEWIRQNRPKTSIIVITAFGSASVRKVALQKGAYHYLDKPVDPVLLLDLLRATRERDSFAGTLAGVDLFDYVQMLLVARRQLVVEVHSQSGERGKLFITDGNVIHAECSDVVGEEAFFCCLSFKGGSFSSLPWQSPKAQTIERRGDFLLLDAAREKDETARNKLEKNRTSQVQESTADEETDIAFDLLPSRPPQQIAKEVVGEIYDTDRTAK